MDCVLMSPVETKLNDNPGNSDLAMYRIHLCVYGLFSISFIVALVIPARNQAVFRQNSNNIHPNLRTCSNQLSRILRT